MNEIPTNNPDFFPDGLMKNVVTEATISTEYVNNNNSITREEKQLLLKDLCARIPYRVKMNVHHYYEDNSDGIITLDVFWLYDIQIGSKWEIKPYLRPLSSMTEEEENFVYNGHIEFWIREDYCNKHHLDYRGLIEKGLALEALEGMYKME